MLKKILFFISILFFSSQIYATGYQGSNTFNMPGVSVAGSGVYSFQLNQTAPGSYFPGTFNSLMTSTFRMQSVVFGSNFNKSMFGSGVTDITLSNVGNGVVNGWAWWLALNVRHTGTGYAFYLVPYTQAYSNTDTTPAVAGTAVTVYTLPENYSCWPDTTDTDNCIVMVKPVFYFDDSTTLRGTYVAYSDIAIYNASGSHAVWNRYYWDTSQGSDSASWFQSALQWATNYNGTYGALIWNQYSPMSAGQSAFDYYYPKGAINPNAQRFHYQSLTGDSPADDTLMRDFMVGATGSNLSVTAKTWFWFSTLDAVASGTGSSGNISGSGTSQYYSTCTTFLEVGCYVKGAVDSVIGLLPNITGSGGWFEVIDPAITTSTGYTNTGCTIIDENLHYSDTTNANALQYKSSLVPVQYVFDIANSIVWLFAVTMKSFIPSDSVCLFGLVMDVPDQPSFANIGWSGSMFSATYNARFGGVTGDIHTWPIQSFFDLFFVFIFTIAVLLLVKPILVIEI